MEFKSMTPSGVDMEELPENMTMNDIAKYLNVGYQHVRRMRTSSVGLLCRLPEPKLMVGNKPIWDKKDIMRWALETGRIHPITGEPVHIGNHKPAK
jgi:hypothetical protein